MPITSTQVTTRKTLRAGRVISQEHRAVLREGEEVRFSFSEPTLARLQSRITKAGGVFVRENITQLRERVES